MWNRVVPASESHSRHGVRRALIELSGHVCSGRTRHVLGVRPPPCACPPHHLLNRLARFRSLWPNFCLFYEQALRKHGGLLRLRRASTASGLFVTSVRPADAGGSASCGSAPLGPPAGPLLVMSRRAMASAAASGPPGEPGPSAEPAGAPVAASEGAVDVSRRSGSSISRARPPLSE